MAKKKERDGIVLLNEHMLFAEEVLSKYERAELYDAIRAYSMEDVLPDLTIKRPEWRGIFRIMRAAQDKVIRKYDETCERNRERINKRWHGQRISRLKASEDTGNTESTENTESTGYTENTKQNKSKQIKTKQNEPTYPSSLKGQEVEGVPGVVWA